MTQWEIYDFPFPLPVGQHPFVIISSNTVCQDKRVGFVNVFVCTTVRGNRSILDYEVLIDQEDGMDFRTAVACNAMFMVPKADIPAANQRRGLVSTERRRAIANATIRGFALHRF
jgi:hypothetical protein